MPKGAGLKLNKGVAALARELGVSAGYVSSLMSKGLSVEQIQRKVGVKAGPKATVQTALAHGKMKGYTPTRANRISKEVQANKDKIEKPTGNVESTVAQSVSHRVGTVAEELAQTVAEQGESWASAELRKKIADADYAEFKAAILKREYYRKLSVDLWASETHGSAVNRLRSMPDHLMDTCAVETDPVKIRALIMEEVEQVCAFMRTYEQWAGGKQGSEEEAA